METRHRPRRPGRTDLVVLCDVSGSVANFASCTLMLVFALREQFNRVRARHSWWLNPEQTSSWNAGDSAARDYGRLVPRVECRNLTQLGEVVHDLA